jgi:hypothetical protein
MFKRFNNFARLTLAAAAMTVASASVANAEVIDLVNTNSGDANGALYVWVDQQTTGTGVIEPFLRVQADGVEQGYNSDLSGNKPWDTKTGSDWTRDLQFSELVTKTIGSTTYFEFLLDINQNQGGDNELLSLDQVRIYTRTGAISSAPDNFSTVGTLRFNSDVGADGDSVVELDFGRNPGSGAGDMFLYVPTSLFAGVLATDYVYFYSLFGNSHTANDGFEEWALVGTPSPTTDTTTTTPGNVPEPGVLLLLGTGLAVAAQRIRRRRTV